MSFSCVSRWGLGPGLFITAVLKLRSGLVAGCDGWQKVCSLILLLLLHLRMKCSCFVHGTILHTSVKQEKKSAM